MGLERGGARPRGALEAEVLGCLAERDGMTASEVQSALGGQLAYTTVMTTLARLYRKGAIERVAEGRAFRYSLVETPERAKSNITAHQMIKLLDGESDRAGALSRFVSELGAEDEQLLSELLHRPPDGDGESDGPRA